MTKLILVRHGESAFNAKSLWTGIWDVPLTPKGRHDAALTAAAIEDLKPDLAFTSKLSRASDTLKIILEHNHWNIPVHAGAALNERDYGDLTGMNKWDVEERYGQDQFAKWRRGWDEPVPNGETLKMVYARVVPYYCKYILPELISGRSVIVAAHGNSIRALTKYLENLSDKAIETVEMLFGQIVIYDVDNAGAVDNKAVIKLDITKPPA
jgi:2,3-bisphosphoglycerate-dependent phosphoglycerate mutase